jgi:hypothetical protein
MKKKKSDISAKMGAAIIGIFRLKFSSPYAGIKHFTVFVWFIMFNVCSVSIFLTPRLLTNEIRLFKYFIFSSILHSRKKGKPTSRQFHRRVLIFKFPINSLLEIASIHYYRVSCSYMKSVYTYNIRDRSCLHICAYII